MIQFDPVAKRIIAAFVVVILACVLFSVLTYCQGRESRSGAVATGKALDKVAREVPAIREDQKEREDAVEEIEGSDAPLPAGYGRKLEQLRHPGNTR